MTAYTVYELSRDGVPFYVGQTSNVETRLESHRVRYGRDITMKLFSSHICRMEAKWYERERVINTLGEGNYSKQGFMSELLYPLECGNPTEAKRRFTAESMARGEVHKLTNFGWDYYAYPTSYISDRPRSAHD